MVQPGSVLRSIKTSIKESDRLPDSTSYSTFEVDQQGGQSNVRPPVVEIIVIDTIRNRPHNTDLAGFATDSNGNHIGRIYDALFEMNIQIDVWTAEGDRYNPYDIGQSIRTALYKHDHHQRGDPLPDPESPADPLGDIDYVTVGDGRLANDLTMTPALRRWRQTMTVWFHETINTAEEYGAENFVVDVVGPEAGSSEAGTDVEIVFDATPGDESDADNYT